MDFFKKRYHTFGMKYFLPLLLTLLLFQTTAHADTWRYRMIVTVETPEGIKTGSTVREVTSSLAFGLESGWHHRARLKGEAVVVDLGERGVLFGLLDHSNIGTGISSEAAAHMPGFGQKKDPGTKWVITPDLWPRFVHFKNLNDAKTVELVLEMESDHKWPPKYSVKADHTGEIFGKGVKIKAVTVETTKDPLWTDSPATPETESYLPWLESVKMSYLNGEHHSRNSPLGLAGYEFIIGQ